MPELVYLDVGRRDYARTLELQRRLVEQVAADPRRRAYLVLVEHDPPVITLGRRGGAEHVLASAAELAAAGIEVHESSRGGDVTYHGPGQIVGYPIVALETRGRDVHRYLRDVEQVVIRTLGRFGIEGVRREGLTGVWAGDRKIAAVGIAVRRWVSYHGFALNVSVDLSRFETIVPCGLNDKSITSMAELLDEGVDVGRLKGPLIECVADVFGFDPVREGGREDYDA